ncbi:cytidylyltransferase domain-containing protein [Flavobacterium chuncheonense]|uniref:Cytidylyltransferase domain-containing protein n=1 Tax=Flavobacterium chuncheonense TaxID=2026653 RepID=A0ABW5YJ27_9FLAO
MEAIFIQARLGSTRLPNKVILPFYKEKSILELLIDKIKNEFKELPIVVCTTTNKEDDKIEKLCVSSDVICFRGDEYNVLNRFVTAAVKHNITTIIRICADNPFLDISLLKDLMEKYKVDTKKDYWSYKNQKQIPVIKTHFGFFGEIVSLNALKAVQTKTDNPVYLEHVTNYIYSHTNFDCSFYELPDYLKERNDLRFTIDDIDDFELMQQLYKKYEDFEFKLSELVSYVSTKENITEKMIYNINKYSK